MAYISVLPCDEGEGFISLSSPDVSWEELSIDEHHQHEGHGDAEAANAGDCRLQPDHS